MNITLWASANEYSGKKSLLHERSTYPCLNQSHLSLSHKTHTLYYLNLFPSISSYNAVNFALMDIKFVYNPTISFTLFSVSRLNHLMFKSVYQIVGINLNQRKEVENGTQNENQWFDFLHLQNEHLFNTREFIFNYINVHCMCICMCWISLFFLT